MCVDDWIELESLYSSGKASFRIGTICSYLDIPQGLGIPSRVRIDFFGGTTNTQSYVTKTPYAEIKQAVEDYERRHKFHLAKPETKPISKERILKNSNVINLIRTWARRKNIRDRSKSK